MSNTISENNKTPKEKSTISPEIEPQDTSSSSQFRTFRQLNRDSVKKNLAQMTTRQEKIRYLVHYYKVPVIITCFILIAVVYLLHAVLTKKDFAFNCVVVNDTYNETFANKIENTLNHSFSYNKKHSKVYVSSYTAALTKQEPGYYSGDNGSQSIFLQLSSGLADTIICNKKEMEWFCKDDVFCDLSTTLSPELYRSLKPYILTCKDANGEEHPFALDLSSTDLCKQGKTKLKTPCIGIVNNTKQMKRSIKFIEKIYGLSE